MFKKIMLFDEENPTFLKVKDMLAKEGITWPEALERMMNMIVEGKIKLSDLKYK
jgi:transposase